MNKLKDVLEIKKDVTIDLNKVQYITLIAEQGQFHSEVELKMIRTKKVFEYAIEIKDYVRLLKILKNNSNFELIKKIGREKEKLKIYYYTFNNKTPIKPKKTPKFIKKQLESQLFVLEYSMKKMKIDFDILKRDIEYYKEEFQKMKGDKNYG